ncbi:MAG: hypothetical protein C0403_10515 [Desulfobacterium sp.]|nr:hypothetical protein [Desulfobacterium sp.]
MSIRMKTILILVGTALVLLAGLYIVLTILILDGFNRVEKSDAHKTMERLKETFETQTEEMCSLGHDWAIWDDTYIFAEKNNQDYFEANIASFQFVEVNVDFLIIINDKNKQLVSVTHKENENTIIPLPSAILDAHFKPTSEVLTYHDEKTKHSGILLTDGFPPALFCSIPILTSTAQGPYHGFLVFGRFLSPARKAALAEKSKLTLTITASNEPGFSKTAGGGVEETKGLDGIDVVPINDDTLKANVVFKDFYGKGELIVSALMPRTINKQARTSMTYILIVLIIMVIFFMLSLIVLIEKIVLNRLSKLSKQVSRISETFDFSTRVDATGVDEISALGDAINGLMAAVEQVNYISEEEKKNETKE